MICWLVEGQFRHAEDDELRLPTTSGAAYKIIAETPHTLPRRSGGSSRYNVNRKKRPCSTVGSLPGTSAARSVFSPIAKACTTQNGPEASERLNPDE